MPVASALPMSALMVSLLLAACTATSPTIGDEVVPSSHPDETARCVDRPQYPSPSQATLIGLKLDTGVVCRWIGPGPSQGPQLIREVSLTRQELAALQAQLGSAHGGIADCGDYQALRNVSYTIYLGDAEGGVWRIEVPDDFCLGFQLGGKPYGSGQVTKTLRLVTKQA